MTIQQTIWLCVFLHLITQVVLFFALPWVRKKIQDHQEYKRTLLEMASRGLQDHVELGRMIQKQNETSQPEINKNP